MNKAAFVAILVLGSCSTCLSHAADIAPADETQISRWIRDLSSSDAQTRKLATDGLLNSGSDALKPLLRTRDMANDQAATALDPVLNRLRARICLPAQIAAVGMEIKDTQKEIEGLKFAAARLEDAEKKKTYEDRIAGYQARVGSLQTQSAKFKKMTPEEFELPKPDILTLYKYALDLPKPKWESWNIAEHTLAWHDASFDEVQINYEGMSRSGPFYLGIAFAAPVRVYTSNDKVRIFKLMKAANRYNAWYVYAEPVTESPSTVPATSPK